MAGIPMRFKRVMASLDEGARARLCQSSGSEHSPENSPELADLVDSFLERQGGGEEGESRRDEEEKEISEPAKSSCCCSDADARENLESLLGRSASDDERRIRAETEAALRSMGTTSGAFKRKLMGLLRQRGVDAGLCKSRWERTGTFPAGEYEYIDVVVDGGKRYIVEVELAGAFDIARPTDHYLALLEAFPAIFVGRSEQLKKVVRLMCAAAKESIKCREMHVPPWRRNGYMMGKWFGSYTRTTNVSSSRKAPESAETHGGKKAVGFAAGGLGAVVGNNCRGEIRRDEGFRVGNLAVALKGMQS